MKHRPASAPVSFSSARRRTVLSLLLVSAGVYLHAQSADPAPTSVPGNESASSEFKKLDANEDGRISRSEFLAAKPDKRRWWRGGEKAAGEATEKDSMRPETFTAFDQNRDGFLSEAELANAQMQQNVRGRLNRDGKEGNNSLNQHPEIKTTPGSNTADPSAEHHPKRDGN